MKRVPAFVILTIFTIISAILLTVTDGITRGPIERAAMSEAAAAYLAVLPGAETFEPLQGVEGGVAVYTGMSGGQVVGSVAVATAQGFAGPIEVTLGINPEGSITGLKIGGKDFAETAGLGTKVQEPAFTDQFVGASFPVALGDTVDGVSGATISSRAAVEAVNLAGVALIGDAATLEFAHAEPTVEPEAQVPAQTGDTATASVQGSQGPVEVTITVDADGTITGMTVGGEQFVETPGLGDKVKEEAFTSQFIGKKLPIAITDIDAVTGATVSTQAVVDAANAAFESLAK